MHTLEPTPADRPRRAARVRLGVAAAWIVVIAGYQLWAFAHGHSPRQAVRDLVEMLRGNAWGPLLFVGAYLVRPLLLLSSAMLSIGAGYLYGFWAGLGLVALAANGSALVGYAVGRLITGDAIDSAPGRLARGTQRVRVHGFMGVLLARLLFIPYDLVSYAAGTARIPVARFAAATVLGTIPGMVSFVSLGTSLATLGSADPHVDRQLLALSAAMLLVALALAATLRSRHPGSTLDRGRDQVE